MNEYFVFILAEKASILLDWMCRQLKVSRASFYRWLMSAKPTPTQIRHDELDAHVVRVYTRETGMAGRDQITTILRQEGVSIACGTVGSILTSRGLRTVTMRAWKKTTIVDLDARTEHIQNHMLDKDGTRAFTSTTPGTRFCGDITYLRTGSEWLYLATVIDLCTRMVVGWSMASHMRKTLIIDALEMARDHGHLCAGWGHRTRRTRRELASEITATGLSRSYRAPRVQRRAPRSAKDLLVLVTPWMPWPGVAPGDHSRFLRARCVGECGLPSRPARAALPTSGSRGAARCRRIRLEYKRTASSLRRK